MKISFLIPSKNRLDLLRHALGSILSQTGLDFEVIVCDNASEEDYATYVAGLGDDRIIYFRQPKPVPVTENWTKALSLATGDYVLMLGDDDALCPDFVDHASPFVVFDGPDVIYLAAFHYAYPGVFSPSDGGYMARLWWEFVEAGDGPSCLVPAFARDLARSVIEFRHRFGYNAQHFLLKRDFIDRVSSAGGLYQSPYPDFFAAMLVFHRARDIVVIPDESVIIGISPKSFGAYYFSERQSEGYGFLDNRHIDESVRDFKEKYAFPGDLNNTNWLVSAEMARRVVESELDQPVDVDRYQVIQLLSLLREHFVLEKPYAETMGELACRLSRRENLIVELLRAILDAGEKEERTRLLAVMNRHIGQYPPSGYSQVLDIGHHHDISDAMAWLRNGRRAAAATDVNESSKTNSAGSPQEYRPEEKVRRPNDGWNDVVTRCRQVLARWLSP